MSRNSKQKVKNAIDKSIEKDFREIRDGSRREISSVCQDYLKALVDTRSAKKVGVPSISGGAPGRTGIVRYTQQIEVQTGLSGFGFLGLNLTSYRMNGGFGVLNGPFQDGSQITYTTNNFLISNVPQGGISEIAGVTTVGWSQSPYVTDNLKPEDLQWRVVGCTVTVFPDDSFSRQNGRIVLLEPPSHVALNQEQQVVGTVLESYPTARVLRGVQTGSQSEKIVLNWHPRGRTFDPDIDTGVSKPWAAGMGDFSFMSGVTTINSNTSMFIKDGYIGLHADAGTSFHMEVTCMYEVRGKVVSDLKPRLTDSRGMDLVMNTLAAKLVSGYVGKPEHVYESYLSRSWEAAKKLGGFISRHENELMSGAGAALRAIGGFI